MVVVRHQTEGMHDESTICNKSSNPLQKSPPIVVVVEDRHPSHTPGHQMIDRPIELDSRGATHRP